jgi:tetratricopeptide (TPR) repeat protein
MTGNVDTAIDDFSRAIKIEPTNSRVYLDRANAYRLKNEFNQAIQDLNSSVRLNPTNDVAYKTRAACYSQVHNYKDAIQDWSEGLRLRREDAIALACRGGDYFMDSQFDKALADVYAAIRMDSTNCLAYDWLAWLRATCPIDSMRNGKEAVEAATKACEMSNWKNTDWIDTLAAAYAETGDFEEAVKYEKQALAGESLSVSARNEWQHRLSMYEQKKPNHNGQKE